MLYRAVAFVKAVAKVFYIMLNNELREIIKPVFPYAVASERKRSATSERSGLKNKWEIITFSTHGKIDDTVLQALEQRIYRFAAGGSEYIFGISYN